MKILFLNSLFLFLISTHTLLGQNLSNYHSKTFSTEKDSFEIDNHSIIEESIAVLNIDGTPIKKELFSINNIDAKFLWILKPVIDSIKINYRTFPYRFAKRVFTNDYNQFKVYDEDKGYLINTSALSNSKNNLSIVDFGKLQYDGNISRGISFGNSQNLNVNSSFNLQLSGMLTKEIEIKASITDSNIPIQPEGNTALLQDFDQIFIELRYKKHFMKLGDFELKSPKSYFLRFNKRLQGVSYRGDQKLSNDYVLKSMAGIGVSKGKYAINELQIEDGIQGPYKLRGTNNENFIIIISGTERVFINGERMKRGSVNDYVIDYNLGEIKFTSKKLMTKDLRVKVEFEYADKNYFRYLYHVQAEVGNDIWSIGANFYSEQDIKEQSINQDLSDDQKNLLTTIGDSISNAYFSGAKEIEFSNDRVIYNKIDTTIDGNTYSIYKYSTDSTKTSYALNFSFVGEGKGNYNPIASIANGRVFRWEKPIQADAELGGSYEPVVLLITPKSNQVLTTNVKIKPTKNTNIHAEFAMSIVDQNTFSTIHNEDDNGIALTIDFDDKRYLNKDSTLQFEIGGKYEMKQRKFIPLQRYREIEFIRNWNVEEAVDVDEHLSFVEANLVNTKKGNLSYRFSNFIQSGYYQGYENKLQGRYKENGWEFSSNVKWLLSNTSEENSNYIVPRLTLSKRFEKLNGWTLGFNFFNEINSIKNNLSDTLSQKSFWWEEYEAKISSNDSVKNKVEFAYKLRREHLPEKERFQEAYLISNSFSVKGKIFSKNSQSLLWDLTYRNLQQDTTIIKNSGNLEHFYLGKINYRYSFLKNVFRGNTIVELGSGRERRVQYNYVKSPDEIGNYAWRDINQNGIQEINEFYVSNFQNENKYLRFILNTLEFQPVNVNRFAQSFQINPKIVWFNKKGIKGFLARFSNMTSINLNKKIFSSNAVDILDIINPLTIGTPDSIIVSNSTAVRNVISFNKSHSVYGIDYNFSLNENVILLTSGFERRKLLSNTLKVRWNIIKTFSVIAKYKNGLKQNNSDFYFDRRYGYVLNEFETDFQWIYKTFFKMGVNYKYAFRSNYFEINGGQFAVINEAGINLKFVKSGNYNILAGFTYSTISYNDQNYQNEQLEIDMLQGLKNGNNFVWMLSLDKTIAKNFQISIIYDGRKTGDLDFVHTGRAQVRAIF